MTIIYNCDSAKKRKPLILDSSRRYFSHSKSAKNKFRHLARLTEKNFGRIKTLFIVAAPFLIISGYWLYLYGRNISLDYRVFNLKQELSQIEKDNSVLEEKVAKVISFDEIKAWAETNGFSEVKNISYLNLNSSDLIQAKAF